MSNSKTAIAEIKKLMRQFGFMSDEASLKSFKLEDNTILEAKELVAGEAITKINDEFERVALEDGKFRLVENFEIEVKDGKIETVKEIFVEAKLADGTVIKVEGDSLVEGAKVVVATEEAEIPAPDGVHELEDGSKVETKDGVIVKVEEALEDEAKDMEPQPPAIDKPETEGKEVEVEMIEMLKDFVKKMSDKMASMEQKMESVENQFAAFKKEPAAKPIANGKTEKFNNVDNNDLDDKIAKIMSLRNTLK